MTSRPLKHWGWGYADEQPSLASLRESARGLREHLGFGSLEPEAPAPLPSLPPPRVEVPASLAGICSVDDHVRARHSYGRSYRDVVRGFRGAFESVTDVVALPGNEGEVAAVLEWALGAGAAVVPYGGGTSVVGGVEPPSSASAVVTVDVGRLDRVLEVDEVSLSARIQAGASGPVLEEQLGLTGLTLRHFPQSFQLQTLGGAIATRAGGHFATRQTHIDDFVESVRALTPVGVWESRRLPGSGAGVSPDRMLLGSEGVLGVITEAWVRVLRRPSFRASTTVRFARWSEGVEAVRAVVQSGLTPANCRLIDADEARLTFAGDGSYALLLLGFESAAFPVDGLLRDALGYCEAGQWDELRGEREGADAAAGVWRSAFVRAPYLRDTFVALDVISETFESAITWERLPGFVSSVLEATRAAVVDVCGAPGSVTCRLTHVYPDGAAPYFTVLAPALRGFELEQWGAVKAAASEAVLAGGGTITHHHAVGRDHRPWYDLQRPEVFSGAIRAAKLAVDPTGALNPGVLFD